MSGTIWLRTRHFMVTGVRASGLKLFRVDESSLLGTGIMVEDYIGTTAWDNDIPYRPPSPDELKQ